MTVNQKAWNKEIKRIRRFINRASKRGYVFDVQSIIPERPTRITKSMIDRLKYRTTPEMLYRKSVFVYPTGEAIAGTERRTQERRFAAERGRRTRLERERGAETTGRVRLRNIFDTIASLRIQYNFDAPIADLKNGHYDALTNLLNNAIFLEGEEQVINRLTEDWFNISSLLDIVYHKSQDETVQMALSEIAEILKGRPLSDEEMEVYENYAYEVFDQ